MDNNWNGGHTNSIVEYMLTVSLPVKKKLGYRADKSIFKKVEYLVRCLKPEIILLAGMRRDS